MTIPGVTKHFTQLLESTEKKVKSGMKFPTFKLSNFETNRFTEMWKQTQKMKYEIIYNVESLSIFLMEDTLDGRNWLKIWS